MSALHLPSFRLPFGEPVDVRFSSWEPACIHLCDHALTPPEMYAWALLIPDLRELCVAGRARFRVGREIFVTEGAGIQDLFDDWFSVIERSVGDAAHLGWVFDDGGDKLYFGPEGLLVVVGPGGHLRSAYFPLPFVSVFPGEPESGDASVGKRRMNPFPREGRWTAQEDSHFWQPGMDSEAEERARFRLFRRTAGSVRTRLIESLSRGGGAESEALSRFRRVCRHRDLWRQLVPHSREEAP